VEVSVVNSLTDTISGRLTRARLGEQVEKDRVAVRIGPDWNRNVVAASSYCDRHGKPATPYDLQRQNGIHQRLPTPGPL